MCFVDFKKAYDSVWRKALMLKILETGIRGNMFKVIENMYIGGKSCIKTDGYMSRDFECESGVRQGDVLSPNLFNIFVNDLPKCFVSGDGTPVIGKQHLNCLVYADDLVVLSLSLDDLQIKSNYLKEYCQEWGLEVNRSKTKVMFFFSKNGHKQPTRNIYIGSEPLEWVSSYKYLGIEVQNHGNMTNSSKNLCKRSWKAIFMLNASLKILM